MQGCAIGIDPGRSKCGYAMVLADGTPACVEVLAAPLLGERIERDVRDGCVEVICVGDATTSEDVVAMCRRRWPQLPLAVVDERNTTYEARRLYYERHPPRGVLRFVPRGLLVPKEPLDGYAALLIVKRWRAQQQAGGGKP